MPRNTGRRGRGPHPRLVGYTHPLGHGPGAGGRVRDTEWGSGGPGPVGPRGFRRRCPRCGSPHGLWAPTPVSEVSTVAQSGCAHQRGRHRHPHVRPSSTRFRRFGVRTCGSRLPCPTPPEGSSPGSGLSGQPPTGPFPTPGSALEPDPTGHVSPRPGSSRSTAYHWVTVRDRGWDDSFGTPVGPPGPSRPPRSPV